MIKKRDACGQHAWLWVTRQSPGTLSGSNTGVDFFFGAHLHFGWNLPYSHYISINSTHNGGVLQKKGHHLLCCSFCVTSCPNCHQARVRCRNAFTYRDKRLNTAVLAMLAEWMKNRDFRLIDRDKAWKNGTVPAKTGRMVSLFLAVHEFWVNDPWCCRIIPHAVLAFSPYMHIFFSCALYKNNAIPLHYLT